MGALVQYFWLSFEIDLTIFHHFPGGMDLSIKDDKKIQSSNNKFYKDSKM